MDGGCKNRKKCAIQNEADAKAEYEEEMWMEKQATDYWKTQRGE